MHSSKPEQSTFHPIVSWGQNESFVFLLVQLRDAENVCVSIKDEHLSFSAMGNGAQGYLVYQFQLDFYLHVVAESSSHTVNGSGVRIKLRKELRDTWPRLNAQPLRLPWARVDFDLYHFEASDLESSDKEGEEAKLSVNFIHPSKEERAKHNAEMKELEDEEEWDAFMKILKNPLTIYLLLFNLFQLAGFLSVCITLCVQVIRNHGEVPKNNLTWFQSTIDRLILVQILSFIEPLHIALKWTGGKIWTPLFQVFDRSLILFTIIVPHRELQPTSTTFWLFFAWSAVDIIRYSYRIVSVLGLHSGFLKYLRFTVWIPFFPIAFICEGKLMIQAIPKLTETDRFSSNMPNSINMTFNFPVFLHIYLLLKTASFYYLMRHMYVHRRRVIGPRPRIGSDQMGFFSYIPLLRSLLGYETPTRPTAISKPERRNYDLPNAQPRAPLIKQN